jgi:hypothetical protein
MRAPYMFGVHRTKLSERAREVYKRAAEKHGCTFIDGTFPGMGYQRWFEAPNRGAPFDRDIERAVFATIAAELGESDAEGGDS